MRFPGAILLFSLAVLLSGCGGSDELTQSEWERYQEIRAETQALLDDLHRASLSAAKAGKGFDRQAVLVEHRDLYESATVEFLRRVETELQDSIAAQRVTRLRYFLTDCALQTLKLEYLTRTPLLSGARELPPGDRWRGSLPAPIVVEEDRETRELAYAQWISLLQENLELADSWCNRRDSLLQAHGYHSWTSFVTQRLDLDSATVLGCTRAIIAATDGLYSKLLRDAARTGWLDTTRQLDRLDLARFAIGKGATMPQRVYPPKVVLDGLHGSCAAADDLIEKITVTLGTTSTIPVAVPVSAPDTVKLIIPPLGDQRQVTDAIGAFAEALVYCSSDSRDFIDLYLDRELELATAASYLSDQYVLGACEMQPTALAYPVHYALRQLLELRMLCANIQLALTYQPGAADTSDALLVTHTRALGVDVPLPELLPSLFQSDLCSEVSQLLGTLKASEAMLDQPNLEQLLNRLRERGREFALKQFRVDDLLLAFDRLLKAR